MALNVSVPNKRGGSLARTKLRPRMRQFACGDVASPSGFPLARVAGRLKRVMCSWVWSRLVTCSDGWRGSATAVSQLSPLRGLARLSVACTLTGSCQRRDVRNRRAGRALELAITPWGRWRRTVARIGARSLCGLCGVGESRGTQRRGRGGCRAARPGPWSLVPSAVRRSACHRMAEVRLLLAERHRPQRVSTIKSAGGCVT
jgi:hypothetical protein